MRGLGVPWALLPSPSPGTLIQDARSLKAVLSVRWAEDSFTTIEAQAGETGGDLILGQSRSCRGT